MILNTINEMFDFMRDIEDDYRAELFNGVDTFYKFKQRKVYICKKGKVQL
jgi:hypothetical protein